MKSILRLLILTLVIGCLACKDEKDPVAKAKKVYDYSQEHRPQFHFSPEANWMNDPNGMVYHDGEYHLFYQYYPDSTVWGPMHWGHAVSPDLVTWEHLPIALYPDSLGLIFSGSAVIDKGNTSGLGKDGKDPMIAIFTHHNLDMERAGESLLFQYQSIAYSNDNGRTFTKYEGNPVVENPGIKDFRDPKVIWHEETQNWIMVFAAYDKALFYTSPNLKDWTRSGEFGIPGDKRLWECPDLFPMKVEGTNETKWVLITSIQKDAPNGGTATSYFIGDFDGKTFIGNNGDQKWLDYGKDNYALVTWSNAPDDRILSIGWMSNWQYAQVVPTEKWRSAMTLPRALKLIPFNDGYRLTNQPVVELKKLRKATADIQPGKLSDNLNLLEGVEHEGLLELELTFRFPIDILDIRLSNDLGEYVSFGYIGEGDSYFVDRTHAGKSGFSEDFADFHTGPRHSGSEEITLHVFIDHSSIEMFADDGRTVMTEIFFPNEDYDQLMINTEMGTVNLVEGKVHVLEGIW